MRRGQAHISSDIKPVGAARFKGGHVLPRPVVCIVVAIEMHVGLPNGFVVLC